MKYGQLDNYKMKGARFVAIFIALLAATAGNHAFASGGTTHQVIADVAIDKLQCDGAKEVLSSPDNTDSFRTGVIFPDLVDNAAVLSGDHLWTDRSGEEAVGHLAKFGEQNNNWIGWYIQELRNGHGCGPGDNRNSSGCNKKIAFVLGSVAHIITDFRFDRKFAGLNSDNGDGIRRFCPSIANDHTATAFTDQDLDTCLAIKINDPDRGNDFEITTVKPSFFYAHTRDPIKYGFKKRKTRYGLPYCKKPVQGDNFRKVVSRCEGCPVGYEFRARVRLSDRTCEKKQNMCTMLEIPDDILADYIARPPLPAAIDMPKSLLELAFSHIGHTFNDRKVNRRSKMGRWMMAKRRAKRGNALFMANPTPEPKLLAVKTQPKAIFDCEWGLNNFWSAPGGVEDTSTHVALFLDELWGQIDSYLNDEGPPPRIKRNYLRSLQVFRGTAESPIFQLGNDSNWEFRVKPPYVSSCP